eukprot:gb/GEZN01006840.1/.p1 GENE.gb/GEZN01006840.1/~~gb/GEZN01006840.1/.p1  ORF type:complete len:488 (-),score=48.56 gb/GEZN01006840.1/:96-1559(-)
MGNKSSRGNASPAAAKTALDLRHHSTSPNARSVRDRMVRRLSLSENGFNAYLTNHALCSSNAKEEAPSASLCESGNYIGDDKDPVLFHIPRPFVAAHCPSAASLSSAPSSLPANVSERAFPGTPQDLPPASQHKAHLSSRQQIQRILFSTPVLSPAQDQQQWSPDLEFGGSAESEQPVNSSPLRDSTDTILDVSSHGSPTSEIFISDQNRSLTLDASPARTSSSDMSPRFSTETTLQYLMSLSMADNQDNGFATVQSLGVRKLVRPDQIFALSRSEQGTPVSYSPDMFAPKTLRHRRLRLSDLRSHSSSPLDKEDSSSHSPFAGTPRRKFPLPKPMPPGPLSPVATPRIKRDRSASVSETSISRSSFTSGLRLRKGVLHSTSASELERSVSLTLTFPPLQTHSQPATPRVHALASSGPRSRAASVDQGTRHDNIVFPLKLVAYRPADLQDRPPHSVVKSNSELPPASPLKLSRDTEARTFFVKPIKK